ncbi:GNAT family N-acetyltransferase [Caballeronia zhejiangensis]|uniref:GNAT family N-acetyltransferase n=1 Tax=Caballeronia zhejiangensis TaxID=871203 RepID=UPI0032217153
MRSIVVARDARGFGLGETIIAHLLTACRTRAVRSVVLLTTTAEHYFAGQGFAPAHRSACASAGIQPVPRRVSGVCYHDVEGVEGRRGKKAVPPRRKDYNGASNFHSVRGRSVPMKNSSASCRNCVRLHIYRKCTSINIRVPATKLALIDEHVMPDLPRDEPVTLYRGPARRSWVNRLDGLCRTSRQSRSLAGSSAASWSTGRSK